MSWQRGSVIDAVVWQDHYPGAPLPVEVGNHAQDRRVLIRDTKDRRGPVLAFNLQSWRKFTAKIKDQRP